MCLPPQNAHKSLMRVLETPHVIIKPFPASNVVTTPKDAIAESIISNTTRPRVEIELQRSGLVE